MIYTEAKELADKFLLLLRPVCKRIEIVGSVKREKPEVHDIELLIIPNDGYPIPEFGRPKNLYKSHLDKQLADLEHDNWIRQAADKKDGEKYKKRAIVGAGQLNEFCLDLFIVRPETWAIQNVIRTGPSEFSHRFVTNKRLGGLLPDQYEYIRGETRIETGGEAFMRTVVELKEESDAIALLGLGWIEPKDRRNFI